MAKKYYLNGDYEKAKKKNIPVSNQYYVVETNSYTDAKLGEYEKAISTIINVLHRRNIKIIYLAFWAETYLLSNNLEEAYKMAQKAVSQGQNNHKKLLHPC